MKDTNNLLLNKRKKLPAPAPAPAPAPSSECRPVVHCPPHCGEEKHSLLSPQVELAETKPFYKKKR